MIEIIPSILSKRVDEVKKLISRVDSVSMQDSSLVQRVHIDILDGKFADNRTIEPSNIIGLDSRLKFDFHLMVYDPVNWVEDCAKAGADRIIAQIEHMKNQVEYVARVQDCGLGIGLAIDLETSVDNLDPVILNNLDVVLVMSVAAGFGGQKFDTKAIEKVAKLDEIRARGKTPFRICVDGGINEDNISSIRKQTADEVSIGRRLFKGSLADNIKRHRKAAYK